MKKLKRIIAVAICLVLGCSGVVSAEVTDPHAVKRYMNIDKQWTTNLNAWQGARWDWSKMYVDRLTKKEKKEAKKALNKITKKYNYLCDLGERGYNALKCHMVGKYDSDVGEYFGREGQIAMLAIEKLQKGNSKIFDKYVKFNAISNYTDVDFSDYIMTNGQLASYIESGATIKHEMEQTFLEAVIVGSVSAYMLPYESRTLWGNYRASTGTGIACVHDDYEGFYLADLWYEDDGYTPCYESYEYCIYDGESLPWFLASEGFLKSKGYLPEDWVYPKTADCDAEHSTAKTFIYVPDVDYDGSCFGRSDDDPMAVKVKMSTGSRKMTQGYFTVIGDNREVIDTDFVTCSYGKPSFSIADESIATVDSNGVITPHQTGETTITIYVAANGTYEAAERTVPLIVSK